MKSKANQIRTVLLISVNDEIKLIAKKKTLINRKHKANEVDYKDFTIEFNESYSSSSWCGTIPSPSTGDNSGRNENDNDDSCGIICQTRRKSIKLLHSICNLIKPM